MTPLGGALLGMVIVAFDLRLGDFDVVVDPIGWLLVAISLGKLADRSVWFKVATAFAWVGMVVSIPTVFIAPASSSLLTAVDTVLQTGVFFGLCTGLLEVLEPDHPWRGPINAIRWVDLAATVVSLFLWPSAGQVGSAAILVLLLVSLTVAVLFAAVLWVLRRHPALQAAPAGGPAPGSAPTAGPGLP